MKRTLKLIAIAATLAAVATPASASDHDPQALSKSGTKACSGSMPLGALKFTATGTVTWKAPGGSTHSDIFVSAGPHYDTGAMGGGSWSVTTNDWMNDAGTYGYCSYA